jgi:tRNA threonylcarbamoyl adenosine modification protein YeaZ
MNVLAIDTATDRLTIAARHRDGRVATREAPGSRRHAALLGPLVLEALAELDLGLTDVESLLLADGPGSFTGLRIGAAWAKAVVTARSIPLRVASTLLVRAASAAGPPAGAVLGVASALRGELFVAGYRFGPRRVEAAFGPRVLPRGAALPGFEPDRIVADLPIEELAPWPWASRAPIVGPPEGLPRASTLLELLGWDGGTVPIDDPSRWEPVYGRPSEAETRWEREHGRALADTTGHSR